MKLRTQVCIWEVLTCGADEAVTKVKNTIEFTTAGPAIALLRRRRAVAAETAFARMYKILCVVHYLMPVRRHR
jgi:hypothetical protein